MFLKRTDTGNLRDFVRLADAYARNVFREQRRRAGATDVPVATSLETEDERGSAGFGTVELRVLLSSLSPGQRRAILLMLRGGPYTPAERQVMSRVREKLREVFEGFDGLAVWAFVRWNRVRGRLSNPPPAIPALAAVVTAASLGGFYVSGAAVSSPDGRPTGSPRASVAGGPLPNPAALPTRDSVLTASHAAEPTRGTSERPSPEAPQSVAPVAVRASSRLPRSDQNGEAGITVAEPNGRSGWANVIIHDCDSPSQSWRLVCGAASAVPAPEPPTP